MVQDQKKKKKQILVGFSHVSCVAPSAVHTMPPSEWPTKPTVGMRIVIDKETSGNHDVRGTVRFGPAVRKKCAFVSNGGYWGGGKGIR